MGADSTLELTFATIVIIDIFMSGTTTRTDGICRDITFGVFTNDGFYQLVVAFVDLFDEFLVIELFTIADYRRFI